MEKQELFEQCEKEVVSAKTYLLVAHPFFAFLLHKCKIEISEKIPTACVDVRGKISVNPKFFMGLPTLQQKAFLLAHEVMHPAFGIFWRGEHHDPHLSNVAHDHVINLMLKESHGDWLIPSALCDEKFTGMPYEEVYLLIKEDNKSGGKGNGGGTKGGKSSSKGGGDAESKSGDGDGESSIAGTGSDIDRSEGSGCGGEEVEEVDWSKALASAAEAARMMGKLPAGVARAVGELLQPVISWQDQLRLAICEALGRSTLDWSSPARRSEAYGVYTPREDFLCFDVSICVDTSGSISGDELKRAASEIQSIVEETAGEGRYIMGDAAVHGDVLLKDFSPEMLSGGGGTSFVPHFEKLEEYPTKLCIFFTDTFGEFPQFEPDFHVIWAVYKPALQHGASVPFGEIIEVEV